MHVLIRTIAKLTTAGAAATQTLAFTERKVNCSTLTIGRGTDQIVQLADPRVALAHAEIRSESQPGPYRVEAKSAQALIVNGTVATNSVFSFGGVLDLGRYRITALKPDAGTDLMLMVEEREAASAVAPAAAESYRTELAQTGLNRRRVAWIAVAAVLVLGLLLPLILRYLLPDAVADFMPDLGTDRAWVSGPSSPAHAYFQDDCNRCHERPFRQVKNEACLDCHAGVRQHVHAAELLRQPEFASARCGTCHHEHTSAHSLVRAASALCTDCHADLTDEFSGTSLLPVEDFSEQHPPFAPRLARYDAAARSFTWTREPQDPGKALREDTNLVFPHDLHLAREGLDAPEGQRVLTCESCHQPDLGGHSFAAVVMEEHCGDCHRLEFDPAEPQRRLPHGQPLEVAGVVRDYFAARALSGTAEAPVLKELPSDRRRPGAERLRAVAPTAATWSEAQAEYAVEEVFARRSCRYCHVVEQTADAQLPWTVAPVALGEHAMAYARFPHAAHRSQGCADCHAAADSGASSDVLLPDIANCRQCHGDASGENQVASTCVSCHQHHYSEAPLWTAGSPAGAQP